MTLRFIENRRRDPDVPDLKVAVRRPAATRPSVLGRAVLRPATNPERRRDGPPIHPTSDPRGSDR